MDRDHDPAFQSQQPLLRNLEQGHALEGLLDRQIMSPWAASLYEENLRGEVLRAGVGIEEFAELVGLIAANRDKLAYARAKVTS